MRGVEMRKLFESASEGTVGWCERCGEVCDDACRRQALYERVLLNQAWLGVRG
jgi:hypothetical protein